MPPREVVLDTGVLIYLLRTSRADAIVRHMLRFGYVLLSSVVVSELYAGSRSQDEADLVDQLVATVARRQRLVTPTHGDWERAGRLFARRVRLVGSMRPRDHLNDLLILMSAAQRGAPVVTTNEPHFRSWARLLAASGREVEIIAFPTGT